MPSPGHVVAGWRGLAVVAFERAAKWKRNIVVVVCIIVVVDGTKEGSKDEANPAMASVVSLLLTTFDPIDNP